MAIEKFEERRLTGTFNVKCKNEDGTFKVWVADKAVVVSQIVSIVRQYQAQGLTLSLRQLHYQLVSNNWIVNHQTAYKKLGVILDDCRYAGVVDWNAIEDRGRVPYLPYWAHDIADALRDTAASYRLNRQKGQDNIVELWTEKDALSGILRKITSKFHVRLVVNKGYTSSSAAYDAYGRFSDHLTDGKSITILYLGDHDPSGLDMVRDIRERLEFMFHNGDNNFNPDDISFKVVPIGLTMRQIKQYKLPPNPTKLTDTRSPAYINEFGSTCWEVDALKPEVLVQLVEKNIIDQIDVDTYEEIINQEKGDIKKLKAFIATNSDDDTDN